jgi:WD40 repeat protein
VNSSPPDVSDGPETVTAVERQCLRPTSNKGHAVVALRFASDGRARSVGQDGFARSWELQTGREIGKAERVHGFATHFAFRPDGAYVAWAWANEVGVDSLEGAPHIPPVTSGTLGTSAITFSADGRRVIVGKHQVSLSDKREGALVLDLTHPAVFRLTGFRVGPDAVALSADGRRAITGGADGFRWFDVDAEEKLGSLARPPATAVAFVGDSTQAVVASGVGGLALWDLTTKERRHGFDGHTGPVRCLAVSGDSRWLLSGSDDRTARLWDVKSGRELARLTGHADAVTCVAFRTDDRTQCLTGSNDDTIRWWHLAGNR